MLGEAVGADEVRAKALEDLPGVILAEVVEIRQSSRAVGSAADVSACVVGDFECGHGCVFWGAGAILGAGLPRRIPKESFFWNQLLVWLAKFVFG